jgi:hypothetical protein
MRIVTNETGLQFHVGGRKRSDPNRKKRFFAKYRTAEFVVPDVPDCDWTVDANGNLVPGLSDALGNTTLGDCTSAGPCHFVEAVTFAAAASVVLQAADAIRFYSQSTGYDPSNPASDQGGDIPTVLESWRTKGIDGNGAHAIAGWFDVSAEEDPRTLRWLIRTFGGLIAGAELPDAWLQITGPNFTWNLGAPDEKNGHCFPLLGAKNGGYRTITWGIPGDVTQEATASLCSPENSGELFAVVTKESLAKATGLGLAGIDWQMMVNEFDAEGGTVSA